MFIKSYFSHHLLQCQGIQDTSMYFLYKKQILIVEFILHIGSDNWILLFSYSALTIRIVRIVFGNQKMNEYEYRIPLFGPNYSNSRIIRIIRSNTGTCMETRKANMPLLSKNIVPNS